MQMIRKSHGLAVIVVIVGYTKDVKSQTALKSNPMDTYALVAETNLEREVLVTFQLLVLLLLQTSTMSQS